MRSRRSLATPFATIAWDEEEGAEVLEFEDMMEKELNHKENAVEAPRGLLIRVSGT